MNESFIHGISPRWGFLITTNKRAHFPSAECMVGGVDHLCLDWYGEGLGVWGGGGEGCQISFSVSIFLFSPWSQVVRCHFAQMSRGYISLRQWSARGSSARRLNDADFICVSKGQVMHNNVLISISSLGTFEF